MYLSAARSGPSAVGRSASEAELPECRLRRAARLCCGTGYMAVALAPRSARAGGVSAQSTYFGERPLSLEQPGKTMIGFLSIQTK